MVIVYLILFFCFSILAIAREKKNQKFVFVVFLLLTIVATFRPDTMHDYFEYQKYFLGIENERLEIGFKFIIGLLNTEVNDTIFFFALFAILSIGFRLWFIQKYASFFFLSIVVYLANVYILHDMIQIRAAIASAALLWSTIYIYQRKFGRFICVVLLATLFHYSSLAILPLYVLNIHKTKWMYFILPLSYVCYILGIRVGMLIQHIPIDFIQNLYDMYSYSAIFEKEEVNVFNLLHLMRCIFFYFILFRSTMIVKKNAYTILYLKIYVLSLTALVLLSDIPVFAFRISELFQVIEIVLLPLIAYAFTSKYVGKLIVICISLIIASVNIFYIKLLSY